jgi:hypothetical protein
MNKREEIRVYGDMKTLIKTLNKAAIEKTKNTDFILTEISTTNTGMSGASLTMKREFETALKPQKEAK